MAPGAKRQHTRLMRWAPTRLACALEVYATGAISAREREAGLGQAGTP
jgi:hypothetical protein